MQNWYSQNNPRRSNGVAVGRMVGRGRGVEVEGNKARVVATASSTGIVGVGFRLGREQDAKINSNKILIKNCLMRRLYSYSEQINPADV